MKIKIIISGVALAVVGIIGLFHGVNALENEVLTPFTIKESAGVGVSNFVTTVVFPMQKGKIFDTTNLRIVDSTSTIIPAQFEVLNRWWGIDNSVRHVMVHFIPNVDPFTGVAGSGETDYTLELSDATVVPPTNPVAVTETTNNININNGLINVIINKDPLSIILPTGELKSLFYKEDGSLDESFSHNDITFTVEEDGPIRSIIKISSPTYYNSPTDIRHGWALRLYCYANSYLVRAEFQLQNSAMNEALSAPLYFKGHELQLATGASTNMHSIRADNPPTSNIENLPLGVISTGNTNVFLRDFWQRFPNGLAVDDSGNVSIEFFPRWAKQFHDDAYVTPDIYWLDDMRHLYKEVLFDFKTNRTSAEINNLAKTFQYYPVGVIPLEYYAQTKATFDMGGLVPSPSFSFIDNETGRIPTYPASHYDPSHYGGYRFSMDNFGLDTGRKRITGMAGGGVYSSEQFYVSGNPVDYYNAQDFALAEINIRPEWLGNYVHDRDFSRIKPSTNPYGGSSWRKHEGSGSSVITRDYIAGTSQTAYPRDDQHCWTYHIADAYYMSGNKWIYDWYVSMAEFKRVFLENLDPWPDKSNRGMAHGIGLALDAFKATGNQALLLDLGNFIKVTINSRLRPPHNITASFQQNGIYKAATFQIGYLVRSLINYYEEAGGDSVVLGLIENYANWVRDISNYAYYYDITTNEPSTQASGTSLTMIDPAAWLSLKTGDESYYTDARDFVENGIGGVYPYGDFSMWNGDHDYPRLYQYVGTDVNFACFSNPASCNETECRNSGLNWCNSVCQIEACSVNIRADVDQNSIVNTTDAMLTLRKFTGLDMSNTNWQTSITTGDVNCDGSSDLADAVLILRYSLGLDMSGTGWCI